MDMSERSRNGWFQMPAELLLDRGDPYVAAEAGVARLHEYLTSHGVNVVEIDLATVDNHIGFFTELKRVLPFPDWCGNSWDSAFDAFEELKSAWPFPIALVAHGFGDFVQRHPAVALHAVVGLSDFSGSLGREAQQLIVVYAVLTEAGNLS